MQLLKLLLLTSLSFTIPHKVSQAKHTDICCHSKFKALPLYLEAWLAQCERIMSRVGLSYNTCEHPPLGKQVESRRKMV